jgi:hypothetical protein
VAHRKTIPVILALVHRAADVALGHIAAPTGTFRTLRWLHDETLTMLATTGALWSWGTHGGTGHPAISQASRIGNLTSVKRRV